MRPAHRPNRGWIIVLSFVVSLILVIFPLPDWAQAYRPNWAALVMLYWCMALPERVGVGVGWSIGLLLDVLRGTLLGQYALTMAILAFIMLNLYRRVRVFPLWQQSVVIGVLLLLHQAMTLWIRDIAGEAPDTLAHALPALIGMLFWPWVFILLRDLRRQYKVR